MSGIKVAALGMALAFGISACATDEYGRQRPMTDAEKGAIIGAVAGAAIVGIAAKDKRGKKMLLGAVGGGLAGAAVGSYMDSQKKDFERQLAPEINAGAITIEKLPQNNLRVTMTGQTAFDFDRTEIKSGFYPAMDKISNIMVRYGKTYLSVVGHTDNVGSDSYNQQLSERRARAVHDYLLGQGVIPERINSLGRGEREPRASNATEEGRRLNRRVEILIEPIVAEG